MACQGCLFCSFHFHERFHLKKNENKKVHTVSNKDNIYTSLGEFRRHFPIHLSVTLFELNNSPDMNKYFNNAIKKIKLFIKLMRYFCWRYRPRVPSKCCGEFHIFVSIYSVCLFHMCFGSHEIFLIFYAFVGFMCAQKSSLRAEYHIILLWAESFSCLFYYRRFFHVLSSIKRTYSLRINILHKGNIFLLHVGYEVSV